MTQVWKYDVDSDAVLSVPKGAEILCAKVQNGKICVWFEVDPDEKVMEDRVIVTFGTGWNIPKVDKTYIDTVMINDALVFHVYEVFNVTLEKEE